MKKFFSIKNIAEIVKQVDEGFYSEYDNVLFCRRAIRSEIILYE
jgi:hypothetical protein